MNPDYTKPPYSYFALPGAVRVSPAVMEFARKFGEHVQRTMGGNRVVTFDWAFARSVRRHKDGPTEDIGPGLHLGICDRSDLPAPVVQRVGNFSFAIQIPIHVYEASKERLVDFDETAFSKLVLR